LKKSKKNEERLLKEIADLKALEDQVKLLKEFEEEVQVLRSQGKDVIALEQELEKLKVQNTAKSKQLQDVMQKSTNITTKSKRS